MSFLDVFAQNETIKVTIVEAQPIWKYTAVDTTFVTIPNQIYWTKYSSLSSGIIERKGNNIFLLSSSTEAKSGKDYGFILDKIDIKTGKNLWTHHNTPYNKGEQDFYHQIDFTKNGNIELFGILQEGKKKKSVRKILDANSGKLLKLKVTQDTIYSGLPIRHYRQFVLYPDSLYLSALQIGEYLVTNPPYKFIDYGVTFKTANKDLNFLYTKRHLYDFDSLNIFAIDQPSFVQRLNSKTIVSLAYRDRIESFDNKGTKIIWSDISDPFNIKITQIKDLTNLIPGTKESFFNQNFETFGNTVLLSHRYYNFDEKKNSCYILWLDSIGNIKTYIPIPKHKTMNYEYARPIYANEKFAYVLGVPSSTGRVGADILQIVNGVDSVRFISSLTTAVETESFGILMNGLYEDGYFITGGLTKKKGEAAKTAVQIYCFKASDLGIDFKTLVGNEESTSIAKINMYPNPAHDLLNINVVGSDEILQMDCFDMQGKLIYHCHLQGLTQINTSEWNSGLYAYSIRNSIGKLVKSDKVIIF